MISLLDLIDYGWCSEKNVRKKIRKKEKEKDKKKTKKKNKRKKKDKNTYVVGWSWVFSIDRICGDVDRVVSRNTWLSLIRWIVDVWLSESEREYVVILDDDEIVWDWWWMW